MFALSFKSKKQPKTSPDTNRLLPIDLPTICAKKTAQKANKSPELNTHQNCFLNVNLEMRKTLTTKIVANAS